MGVAKMVDQQTCDNKQRKNAMNKLNDNRKSNYSHNFKSNDDKTNVNQMMFDMRN